MKAKGEYCLFMNRKDYLYTIDVLKNHSIIYDKILMKKATRKRFLSKQTSSITIEWLMFSTIYHSGCSILRRDFFKMYGFYSENFKIISHYYFLLGIILKHEEQDLYIDETILVFNT